MLGEKLYKARSARKRERPGQHDIKIIIIIIILKSFCTSRGIRKYIYRNTHSNL